MTMKLKITPIGSCRITNPLKKSTNKFGFDLNMDRIYGYTHTSAEALQQLKFLLGEYSPSEKIWPILCRTHIPEVKNAIAHSPSDLYFVELSSAKVLKVGTECVQLNYVSVHFSDFFADTARTKKFWSLAKPGLEKEQWASLIEEPIFQAYTKDKQMLLSQLVASQATDDELRRDMLEIKQRVNNVVFVTHCNAKLPGDSFIKAREYWIKQVESISAEIGAEVYNPTSLMEKFGQELSLEKEGLDLTHYSPIFESHLFEDWNQKYIIPLQKDKFSIHFDNAQLAVQSFEDGEFNTLENMYRQGELSAVLRKIYPIVRTQPERIDVVELLAKILYDLGDFEGCALQLNKPGKFSEVNDDTRHFLIKCNFQLERHKDVLKNADYWFSEERWDSDVVYMCAKSSFALGQVEKAIGFWERLYQGDSHKFEAALELATIFMEQEKYALVVEWSEKAVQLKPYDLGVLKRLSLVYALVGNGKELENVMNKLINFGANEALNVINVASTHQFPLIAAKGLSKIHEIWPHDVEIKNSTSRVAAEWLMTIESDNLSNVNVKQWLEQLNALAIIQPRNNLVIRKRREFIKTQREALREAHKNSDYLKAIEAGQNIITIDPLFPSIHLSTGRSYYMSEMYGQALDCFVTATCLDENDQTAWSYRSRSAIKVENYTDALFSLNQLKFFLAADEGDSVKEIDNTIAKVLVWAVKKARALYACADYEAAWTLVNSILNEYPDYEQAQKLKIFILRGQLEQLRNAADDDVETKVKVAASVLEKDESNTVALRVLASEFMKQRNFAAALIYWEKLSALFSETESFKKQIDKCNVMLAKQVVAD